MNKMPRRNTYLLLILLCLAIACMYRPRPTLFSQDDFGFLERVTRAGSLSSFWQHISPVLLSKEKVLFDFGMPLMEKLAQFVYL